VNESFWLTIPPLKAFLYIKTLSSPHKLKAVSGRTARAIIRDGDHSSARLGLITTQGKAERISRGNLLTPWSRVLPEKLKRPQLLKKFPAFYGTRAFITAFTTARHLSLS
jgi:hypothetical protein